MGLYLFNISIDTVDPNPEYLPEDLSINHQESIIEIVVEKFLGYEDAFKEYDEPNTEDQNKNTNAKIDIVVHYTVDSGIKQSFIETSKRKFSEHNTYLTKGFHQLDTPPPKI